MHSSRFYVAVKDLITDKIIWDYSKSWAESLNPEKPFEMPPQTAEEAWTKVKDKVVNKLHSMRIQLSEPSKPEKFPLKTNNDEINIEMLIRKNNSYVVYAVSKQLGKKIIYEDRNTGYQSDKPNVIGFFPNPNKTRIAVIIAENEDYGHPFAILPFLTGSHLKAGFEKQIAIKEYTGHNKVLKDTKNNLLWMKCSIAQSGNACGGKAMQFNWDDAKRICEKIKSAGNKTWRLPSKKELKTLVYCSNGNTIKDKSNCGKEGSYSRPTINRNIFPNTVGNWGYWSSTTYAYDTNLAWSVDFADGSTGFGLKTNTHYVRCVSTGP